MADFNVEPPEGEWRERIIIDGVDHYRIDGKIQHVPICFWHGDGAYSTFGIRAGVSYTSVRVVARNARNPHAAHVPTTHELLRLDSGNV